ncbi:OmpA family protein [Fibrella sp. WM1]|uniref:OmpA family protein n=1 Tax=Fibrella musci TaxID=3242485 RepID=UPI0035223A9F
MHQMRLAGLAFVSILSLTVARAQVRVSDPKQTVERNVEYRVNNKVDQGINRGLDKVEEGIGNIFKKKDKKAKDPKPADEADVQTTDNQTNAPGDQPAAGPNAGSSAGSAGGRDEPRPLKAYSKFDFVAGENVLAYDDFATTNVGDFPLGWNTNSTAELVTLEGKPGKWLFMSKDGFFQPEYVKEMPTNFTLEFDVFTRYNSNNLLTYSLYLSAVDSPKKDLANQYIQDGIYFEWHPCGGGKFIVYEKSEEVNKNEGLNLKEFDCGDDYSKPSFVKFSIWRQKTRLRIYANETKVLDIPQAFDPKLKYNAFKFGTAYMNYATADNKDEFMVANLRYAVGAPDTRAKLITEGKFSTTGILFDINSDKIRPESYGVLKEIGTVLKENAGVRVKIIGHTDSDGDDASNLALSKRRAASVKVALSTEFGIDASRLDTDGKGESAPVGSNTTPEGKANNRRVEFLKL